MLHRLRNGDWIDPAWIASVEAKEGWTAEHLKKSWPPWVDLTVIVRTPVSATMKTFAFPCETIEEARAYRDELAALANAAHRETSLDAAFKAIDASVSAMRGTLRVSISPEDPSIRVHIPAEGRITMEPGTSAEVIPRDRPVSWHDRDPLL